MFSKLMFSKNLLGNSINIPKRSFENINFGYMPNSLDPDQAWHFVSPNLDQNGFPRLSVDDTI